jgi:hypothetical protein
VRVPDLCYCKCHLTSIAVRGPDSHYGCVWLDVSASNLREDLKEPEQDKATLRIYHDMCRADSWSASERHKIPQRTSCLPALRTELFSIGTPYLWVAMHQISIAVNNVALSAENRLLAVFPSARGECCISDTIPHRLEAYWVQPMTLALTVSTL